MSTYDSLHRQCRTLESLFDTKLTSYSRGPRGKRLEERWKDLEVEVEELLQKLGEINDQLSTLSSDSENPPSQSMLRAIQRHREVYQDYSKELRRTKANVQTALDQANLLSGVRNDIDAYKSSAADSLLAERGHIDNSHRMTDDVLAILRQRTTISGINTRMSGVISAQLLHLPGVNNLLSMIKTRRRRDSVIVGCVIGLCIVLLLMYVF
ncbi:V-snare-domain-containing protein [Amylocystis lapponica]|nr:V-snare-domain-containing protein [Amylocystis lapponica]